MNHSWLAMKNNVDETAEIIIDLGCNKHMHGLQLKNLNPVYGGTKQFTIFLSETPEGPWNNIFSSELPKEESECGPMRPFNIE